MSITQPTPLPQFTGKLAHQKKVSEAPKLNQNHNQSESPENAQNVSNITNECNNYATIAITNPSSESNKFNANFNQTQQLAKTHYNKIFSTNTPIKFTHQLQPLTPQPIKKSDNLISKQFFVKGDNNASNPGLQQQQIQQLRQVQQTQSIQQQIQQQKQQPESQNLLNELCQYNTMNLPDSSKLQQPFPTPRLNNQNILSNTQNVTPLKQNLPKNKIFNTTTPLILQQAEKKKDVSALDDSNQMTFLGRDEKQQLQQIIQNSNNLPEESENLRQLCEDEKKSNESLRKELQTQVDEIKGWKEKVVKFQEEIQEKDKLNEQLTQKIRAQEDLITEQTGQLSQSKNLAEIMEKVQEVIKHNEMLQNQIKSNNNKISTMELDIQNKESVNKQLKKQMEEAIQEKVTTQLHCELLQTQLNMTKQNDLISQQKQSEHEREKVELKSKVVQLQDQMSLLNNLILQNNMKQKQIQTQQSSPADLAVIQNQQVQIQDMRLKLQQLVTEVENLLTVNQELSNQVNALNQQLQDQQVQLYKSQGLKGNYPSSQLSVDSIEQQKEEYPNSSPIPNPVDKSKHNTRYNNQLQDELILEQKASTSISSINNTTGNSNTVINNSEAPRNNQSSTYLKNNQLPLQANYGNQIIQEYKFNLKPTVSGNELNNYKQVIKDTAYTIDHHSQSLKYKSTNTAANKEFKKIDFVHLPNNIDNDLNLNYNYKKF